jgi:hypothetical protein
MHAREAYVVAAQVCTDGAPNRDPDQPPASPCGRLMFTVLPRVDDAVMTARGAAVVGATQDEARRVAADIARPRELLRKVDP